MKKSFSYELKSELIKKDREEFNSFLAFCYGIFLFSSSFSMSSMHIKTENKLLAQTYAACALRLASVKATLTSTKGGTYTCEIEKAEDRKKIFKAFSLTGNEFSTRINRTNIDNESVYSDFLAGVFCACGTIADPKKDYHLEFCIAFRQLCKDLVKVINEIDLEEPLNPKSVVRKYEMIVYFKGSEQIEDILFFMGAQNAAFEIVNTKVEKDLRNRANRIMNCDSANLDKTIKAGIKQAQAIRKIKNKLGSDAIPDELQELAQLRLNNPEMSLSELAQSLKQPISRSGVNHRLKKLEKIAEEI